MREEIIFSKTFAELLLALSVAWLLLLPILPKYLKIIFNLT